MFIAQTPMHLVYLSLYPLELNALNALCLQKTSVESLVRFDHELSRDNIKASKYCIFCVEVSTIRY